MKLFVWVGMEKSRRRRRRRLSCSSLCFELRLFGFVLCYVLHDSFALLASAFFLSCIICRILVRRLWPWGLFAPFFNFLFPPDPPIHQVITSLSYGRYRYLIPVPAGSLGLREGSLNGAVLIIYSNLEERATPPRN
jgi:hypothetical protein